LESSSLRSPAGRLAVLIRALAAAELSEASESDITGRDPGAAIAPDQMANLVDAQVEAIAAQDVLLRAVRADRPRACGRNRVCSDCRWRGDISEETVEAALLSFLARR
jgi:hypothetical protein